MFRTGKKRSKGVAPRTVAPKKVVIIILVLLIPIEIFFSPIDRFLSKIYYILSTFPYDVIIDNISFFLFGLPGIISGLALTIEVAVFSLIFASVVGIIFGLMLNSGRWWLRYPAIGYIKFFKSIPLILIIFWFCFLPPGLSQVLRDLSRLHYVVAALGCYAGAYLAEIVRAGILSVGKGQVEAARSLGLGRTRLMIYVIIPQALKKTAPFVINQLVSIIRDTSLLWFIGVMEFTQTIFATCNREADSTVTIGLYLFAMAVYFLICYPLTALSDRFETRLGSGEKREFRRIIGLISN